MLASSSVTSPPSSSAHSSSSRGATSAVSAGPAVLTGHFVLGSTRDMRLTGGFLVTTESRTESNDGMVLVGGFR